MVTWNPVDGPRGEKQGSFDPCKLATPVALYSVDVAAQAAAAQRNVSLRLHSPLKTEKIEVCDDFCVR